MTGIKSYIDGHYKPSKAISIKKPVNAQDTGNTTLGKNTILGKQHSYSCKVCSSNYCVHEVTVLVFEGGGDSFV